MAKKPDKSREKTKYPPNRIKELREAKGLSQERLSKAVTPNTSNQMIGLLERSERELTVTWMNRLAPPLGVEPHELLGEPVKLEDVHRLVKESNTPAAQNKGSKEVPMPKRATQFIRIFNTLNADQQMDVVAHMLELAGEQEENRKLFPGRR